MGYLDQRIAMVSRITRLGSVDEGRARGRGSAVGAGGEDVLISRPVSKAVGNVKYNEPELLPSSSAPP
jgi:hypothetical protein